MMRLFIDSSALAKRYIVEQGTEVVVARCTAADDIILSVICVPELLSAFCRRRREGRMSAGQYEAAKTESLLDIEQASVIDVTPAVIARAIECLEATPVSASDAVHIASALVATADLFLTSDRQQSKAAVRMGLTVEEVPP
jgi:hypothetical protein